MQRRKDPKKMQDMDQLVFVLWTSVLMILMVLKNH